MLNMNKTTDSETKQLYLFPRKKDFFLAEQGSLSMDGDMLKGVIMR